MFLRTAILSIAKVSASLYLTVISLLATILLVLMGTLEQAQTGIYAAQEHYFHTFWVTWHNFPVFPGGYTLGIVLLINLVSAHATRFKLSWRHLGISLLHFGLILFIAGELLTTLFSKESQIALRVGEVKNYTESPRLLELALIDLSDPSFDQVYTIAAGALRKNKIFAPQSLPFTLQVKEHHANATLKAVSPGEGTTQANRGLGTSLSLKPLPKQQKDNSVDTAVILLELKNGSKSLGTWMVSNALSWPQIFRYKNKEYALILRKERTYLPFSLELTEFIHERYAGSNIPKNFMSRLNLYDAEGALDRSATLYMNHPLYTKGRTFYQASFGENDNLSVLHVVENPSWPLPYLSSILVGGGLLAQFLISLFSYRKSKS